MNKYLEKIAKLTEDERIGYGTGGTAISGVGLGVVGHQYHRGNLTGRETLYHGTSGDRAGSIRESGLKYGNPGVSKVGVGDHLHNLNKGRVFMSSNRIHAGAYSAQQDAINKGIIKDRMSFAHWAKNPDSAKEGLRKAFSKDVVVGNIPTWKEGLRKGINPELKAGLKSKIYVMDGMNKKDFFKMYQGDTHTFNKGVPPEYLKGSTAYKPNSASEILDFIKHNPKRFAKGLGKSMVGLGALTAGGYLLNKAVKGD